MLQKYLDQLMFEIRDASIFQLAPSSEDRAAWDDVPGGLRARLTHEADTRLREAIPLLTATDYMRFQKNGDAAAYRAPFRLRRDMLSAAVMGLVLRGTDEMDGRVADLVWAICEESSWTLPENSPLSLGQDSLPLPDLYEPLVDGAAADTACDLCMAAHIAGERLYAMTPQLLQRMAFELDRRLVSPFLAAEDFDWMCGPKSDAFVCLRGVMISFLSFEQDSRRRWQCMRKAWMLMDRLFTQLPEDGSVAGGVSEWQAVAGPVMDCLNMVRVATGGAIDLSQEPQIQLMCHYPVLCHVAEGWFVNPGTQSMKPALNGPAMYRVGMQVRDGALCDLGAWFFRTQGEGAEEPLLMHRCENALLRARLEREKGKPPFRRQGYLSDQQLMVARMEEDSEHGLALAVHGGHNGRIGGHPDVGDVILFAHGLPVLVDAGCFEPTSMHSLPLIGPNEQENGVNRRAEDVGCRLEDDFAMMSMNLAGAYPESARVTSWQRTAIYNREDGTARLIDVFDLADFDLVRFHFITPGKPGLGERFAQLGPVRMRWEAGLIASSEEVPVPEGEWRTLWGETLYRLTLTTEQPVDGGKYTFYFTPLRTFG